MTPTPRSINHEFKELGNLQLESSKTFRSEDDTTESYWLWANFESITTGATYRAKFDDDAIRRFCTIFEF